jgi:hypothetical protein
MAGHKYAAAQIMAAYLRQLGAEAAPRANELQFLKETLINFAIGIMSVIPVQH